MLGEIENSCLDYEYELKQIKAHINGINLVLGYLKDELQNLRQRLQEIEEKLAWREAVELWFPGAEVAGFLCAGIMVEVEGSFDAPNAAGSLKDAASKLPSKLSAWKNGGI